MIWLSSPVWASDIQVITSNRPLALLTQSILGDQGHAQSLLKPGQSPHDFALSFTDRQQLEESQFVVWIGADIEPYLQRILHSLKAGQLRLDQLFELDEHDGNHHDHGHDHHHGHSDTEGDFHLWLSPRHAMTISKAIASELAQQFPQQARQFAQNQQRLAQEITLADRQTRELLSSAGRAPYGIVHNAYSHFIEHYQLPSPQLISQSTEQPPGVRRLLELRQQLPAQSCLLVEPEHANGWPQQLAQRENYRLVQVDTLATRKDYSHYKDWLTALGQDFRNCLTP
ncbi:metal ABC transporter solute-binding protein, Zn/Mn family [Candidatus Pelagadaptatus aseana]|uniref:metal ABC transporter solute-binding protein, Zn/Mn family n=1 Tax=Candidatus Pelagadaptatus aseana TaxID=3120508 RepID=UPI003C6F0179